MFGLDAISSQLMSKRQIMLYLVRVRGKSTFGGQPLTQRNIRPKWSKP